MPYSEIIINYWSQILLLLGVLGWIIKTLSETYLRKKELKYNFFYSNKLASLKNLIDTYHKYERFFTDVPYYRVSNGEINAIELDSMVSPYKDNYFNAHNELILYHSNKELEKFKLIKDNINIVHNALGQLLFKNISVNDYNELLDKSKSENYKIFSQISSEFIKEFN
ncbi:hypothetical protein H8B06_18710 [Sphingobacterium sp. DN00404]|uniref:DUF4760 domain-containing protein n=1 Tax=Sphingobacterium micropteri TaxID=2763501 RepID=A0ABR7YUA0_9SPHI|nr:hypothetical protein [Sphingobacterium micropteri]MBD1434862.1 hypothetical protein [Sphingobacterium micropteri]